MGKGGAPALAGVLLLSACRFSAIEVEPIPLTPDALAPAAAMRLHLIDGSTIVFRSGAVVTDSGVVGNGRRYGPNGAPAGSVHFLPPDSVVQAVRFRARVHSEATAVVNLGLLSLAGLTLWIVLSLLNCCPYDTR